MAGFIILPVIISNWTNLAYFVQLLAICRMFTASFLPNHIHTRNATFSVIKYGSLRKQRTVHLWRNQWQTAHINLVQIDISLSDVSSGNLAIVITVCTRPVSNKADDIEQEIRIIQWGHGSVLISKFIGLSNVFPTSCKGLQQRIHPFLWGKSTDHHLISHTLGQLLGKRVHGMTSSWHSGRQFGNTSAFFCPVRSRDRLSRDVMGQWFKGIMEIMEVCVIITSAHEQL